MKEEKDHNIENNQNNNLENKQEMTPQIIGENKVVSFGYFSFLLYYVVLLLDFHI